MGHTIWVDRPNRPADQALDDNSIMLRLQDQLDGLSEKLGVSKLSDFHDYSELEAMYGDLDEEDEQAGDDIVPEDQPPGGTWYEPGAALAAVRAIDEHLVNHPEALGFDPEPSQAHWPVDLMRELMHCRTVLEELASRGEPFRFLIVP